LLGEIDPYSKPARGEKDPGGLQGLSANCLRYNIEYRLAIPTRSTHHQNDAAGLPQRQSSVENPERRKEKIELNLFG
jgi:hypothetical protein